MLDIDLLTSYVMQFSGQNASPADRAFAQQFANLIDGARNDPTPGVKTWAGYAFSVLVATPQSIDAMLKSNSWESRLLGLHSAQLLSPEIQKQIMAKMAATDGNELVKSYAAATLEVLQTAVTQPAASQPATAPTTPPANPTTRPTTAP